MGAQVRPARPIALLGSAACPVASASSPGWPSRSRRWAPADLRAARRTRPQRGDGSARCGQREQIAENLPPFPEPAQSPNLRERPEGRVVRLPGRPEGMAFDERNQQLAVGINEPRGLIAFADAAERQDKREVQLPGGPRHLRLAAPDGPLLVPAEDASALIEVPLRGGRPQSTPVGRQPHDATGRGWNVTS